MLRQSRKWLLIPIGLLSLTGVLVASASSPSVTSGWVTVASPPGTVLIDVACPTTTDCWGVGVGSANQSAIEHDNGSTWTVVASPNPGTTDELTGVACAGAEDCWAVGLNSERVVAGRPHRALHRVSVDAGQRSGSRAHRRHLRHVDQLLGDGLGGARNARRRSDRALRRHVMDSRRESHADQPRRLRARPHPLLRRVELLGGR